MFDLYTFVIHEREPLGLLVISFHLYLIRQRLKKSPFMRDLNIHIVCYLESALPRLVWECQISIYHNLNSRKVWAAVMQVKVT